MHNDQGNPAAAKNLCYSTTPNPPLGLTALFDDFSTVAGCHAHACPQGWACLKSRPHSWPRRKAFVTMAPGSEGVARLLEAGLPEATGGGEPSLHPLPLAASPPRFKNLGYPVVISRFSSRITFRTTPPGVDVTERSEPTRPIPARVHPFVLSRLGLVAFPGIASIAVVAIRSHDQIGRTRSENRL